MGFAEDYNASKSTPGSNYTPVTFSTKQGSGKKAVLSTGSTGSGFASAYNQEYGVTPEIAAKNMQLFNVNEKLKNIDKLKTAQEKYNAVVNASKLGIIDRTQLGKALEYVKTKQDEKIKSDFQKNLTPLEKASTFVAEGVPQLAKGLYEGTIGAAVQTGDAYYKYMNSKNMQSMNSAVLKDAMAISKKAIADAQAGKISWDKAKQITDQTNKMVSLTSGKANKATKELSKQDAAKVAGAAATTALNLLTLGGAGMVKAGLTGGAKALAGAAGKEALLGTGYGVANVAQTMGKEATAQDYLTGAGVGAAFGGAIPVAGAGLKYVGRKGATALEEATSKIKASKPAQYLFGDKTAVQEAVAKAKAPKVAETPKVEPTVAEKPITPPKKIEVTTPQVTKTPKTNGFFKDETEISQINRILKNEDTVAGGKKIADYYREAKGEDWRVVEMTPDEYLDRAAKAMGVDDAQRWRGAHTGDVEKYAADMKKGDKFPMPWINEVAGSQEGRTRALAAKLAGQDKIKVAVAEKYNPETYAARIKFEEDKAHNEKMLAILNGEKTPPKTPVGEQRVTGGAKTAEVEKTAGKVYERMKAEHPEVFTDETSKEAITLKHDAEVAVESIAKDKQKAFNIAMGAETSPDVTSTATNIALVEQSLKEGKHDLANRLLRSRSIAQKRRGQEISAERLATDNSRTKYMQDLLDMKLKKYGEKYLGDLETKVKKITPTQRALKKLDDDVAKMETKIKTKKLTVDDALGLLEKMACI